MGLVDRSEFNYIIYEYVTAKIADSIVGLLILRFDCAKQEITALGIPHVSREGMKTVGVIPL